MTTHGENATAVVDTRASGGWAEGRSAPLSASPDPAHVVMPGVHRVASLLERCVLGTHQGSIDPAHLQTSLEELASRCNRRRSSSAALVFRGLLDLAVAAGPVIDADVTSGCDRGSHPKWSGKRGQPTATYPSKGAPNAKTPPSAATSQ
jgi:hypothetical protein